jgi:uncharacterized protein DUF4232
MLAGGSAALLLCACAASGQQHQAAQPSNPVAARVALSNSAVVPWIDAAPPSYQPPAMSTPPPLPADARPCGAADVVTSLDPNNGAGGHSVSYVRFRNASRSTCLLAGYPKVTASEPGKPDVLGSDGSFFQFGRPANLAPGSNSTVLGLETDTYCAARPGGGGGGDWYHQFDIALPGGGTVRQDLPGAGLDLTCGLHLTRFEDPATPQPEPIEPLAGLTAALVLPRSAHAGDTLDYQVDLRNSTKHAVDLRPCPAYLEAVLGAVPVKQSYALNCTPIGTMAAGQTVRFAMRLVLPASMPVGPLHISWQTTVGVGTTGTLVITQS